MSRGERSFDRGWKPQDSEDYDAIQRDEPVAVPWKVIVLDGDVCINPDRESGEFAIIAHVRKRPNADLIVEAVNAYKNYKLLLTSIEQINENIVSYVHSKNSHSGAPGDLATKILNIAHLAEAAIKEVKK